MLLPLHPLRWHYDLPWWRGNDDAWFSVTPRQFLRQPDDYPEHRRRVDEADLRWPLHVLRRRDRLMILDGIHRLVRADVHGWSQVPAIPLTLDDVNSIIRPRLDGEWAC